MYIYNLNSGALRCSTTATLRSLDPLHTCIRFDSRKKRTLTILFFWVANAVKMNLYRVLCNGEGYNYLCRHGIRICHAESGTHVIHLVIETPSPLDEIRNYPGVFDVIQEFQPVYPQIEASQASQSELHSYEPFELSIEDLSEGDVQSEDLIDVSSGEEDVEEIWVD